MADAEGDEWITTDLFLRWKDRFGAAGPHTWRPGTDDGTEPFCNCVCRPDSGCPS